MVKVVELQEPFPEDEVPSQARSKKLSESGEGFFVGKMLEGNSSNLRCWFWFCCSSHQKSGVLIKKGLSVVGNLFFPRVVFFTSRFGEDEPFSTRINDRCRLAAVEFQ